MKISSQLRTAHCFNLYLDHGQPYQQMRGTVLSLEKHRLLLNLNRLDKTSQITPINRLFVFPHPLQ